MDETTEDLSEAARLVELCLNLLEDPQQLYQRCNDEHRRLLNQALFEHVFIEDEDVTAYDLREPFATLRSVEERCQSENTDKPDPATTATLPKDDTRGVSGSGDAPRVMNDVEVLLAGMDLVQCSSKPSSVGVVQALSHSSKQTKRLYNTICTLQITADRPRTTTSACRTARQLRPAEVDDLVHAYQAGDTVYQLARKFDIHRSTVGHHLKDRGIDTTPPALHPDDISAAADLYHSGWSLLKIGQKFGTTANTVRLRLLEADVVMRRPWERA